MGKSFDLLVFSSSANRAALTAVPLAAGDAYFTADGVAGTGTRVYVKDQGHVAAAMIVSETAAAANNRFHTTNDPSWNYPLQASRVQTVKPSPDYFTAVGYPINKNEQLTAETLNGGAQLDSVGLFLDKGAGIARPWPPQGIPKGYMLVRGTCTLTCVADTWTEGTVVFSDYVLDPDRKYSIGAMGSDSATGHFTRLKFLGGENVDDHPGVPTVDTAAGLDQFMLYGDFGSFNGLQGLHIEQLSEAADAAVNLTFLIKEA